MKEDMKEIFEEIHRQLPRQGAGNNISTRKAFSFLKNLANHPRILDVGCGPGMQTIELALISSGMITAVDIRETFLEELRKRAAEAGVKERIITLCESMDKLSFPPESFDVIWSEGALYIIGFENGMKLWKPFLATDGYMVVSELCWLKNDVPNTARVFWQEAYPAMATIEKRRRHIESAGCKHVADFTLPESAWWDEYYIPLEGRLQSLREKYSSAPDALQAIAQTQNEIDLYRVHSDCYGYIFFIIQKQSV